MICSQSTLGRFRLEVKGLAEILRGNDYVKIVPLKKSSWGLEG